MIDCLASNPAFAARVAERFAAMADENRIRLLMRLRAGVANVNTLAADSALPQATVSKHLAVLRRAGIVEFERKGVQAFYSIRDSSILELCRIVCEGVMRQAKEEHAAIVGAAEAPRPRGRARSGAST